MPPNLMAEGAISRLTRQARCRVHFQIRLKPPKGPQDFALLSAFGHEANSRELLSSDFEDSLRRMSRRIFSRLWPTGGFIVVFAGSTLAGGAYRYYSSGKHNETSDHLNASLFTPYELIDKDNNTATSSIFTLRQPSVCGEQAERESADAIKEIWKRGIWSVQAKQPELQIARSYTPLPQSDTPTSQAAPNSNVSSWSSPSELRLLIRAEKNGEVSNYLHSLPLSSTIDIRGPFLELALPDDIREVIFIAGGTGIAPAMQVAHVMSQRPGVRMHILWNTKHRDECRGGKSDSNRQKDPNGAEKGSRLEELDPWGKISQWTTWGLASGGQKPESALEEARNSEQTAAEEKSSVVQALDVLKKNFETTQQSSKQQVGGLTIQYFVDDENRFVKPRDVSKQLRVVAQDEDELGLPPGKKLILVSGPEGFVNLWAGKKVWMGGKEMQGPLGGYFANLGLLRQGWNVWKL